MRIMKIGWSLVGAVAFLGCILFLKASKPPSVVGFFLNMMGVVRTLGAAWWVIDGIKEII